jgi:hypothetical protein
VKVIAIRTRFNSGPRPRAFLFNYRNLYKTSFEEYLNNMIPLFERIINIVLGKKTILILYINYKQSLCQSIASLFANNPSSLTISNQPKMGIEVFQMRDFGGWKMRKGNSSTLTEGGTKTNRPEKGRNKW